MLVKLLTPVGANVKIGGKIYKVPGIYDIPASEKIPATVAYEVVPKKKPYKKYVNGNPVQ